MYILCVSRNKYDEPIASRTEKIPNFDRLMKYIVMQLEFFRWFRVFKRVNFVKQSGSVSYPKQFFER